VTPTLLQSRFDYETGAAFARRREREKRAKVEGEKGSGPFSKIAKYENEEQTIELVMA
jgi:hypothetical protein